MTSRFALLMLVFAVQAYGQPQGSLCSNTSVPLSFAQAAGISAEALEFGSTVEKSGVVAKFTNGTDKAIAGALIFAELLDINGDVILTVPLIMDRTEKTLPFAASRRTLSDQPWLVGQDFLMSGIVQQATAYCPLRARVDVHELAFTDGSKIVYDANHWQMQAAVRRITPLQLAKAPKTLSSQSIVNVAIDAAGHVTSSEVKDSDAQAWFQSQLSEWVFFPQFKDGAAVPSKVHVLFRIHSTNDRAHLDRYDKTVFRQFTSLIPVDVYLDAGSGTANPMVFVGGEPF